MTDLAVDDFVHYFKAVHGHGPFDWQHELLRRVVASDGRWPATLDLPTGTGKTAVLDIAVFHLALTAPCDGEAARPRAPRRIVLVVDRRTVVDQAADRADTICRALAGTHEDPERRVLATVAARLRSLRHLSTHAVEIEEEGKPLACTVLRGGMPRDDGWARRPDQPLIVLSTVDQVGSRLLFRGYGVTEGMRPIHAGLLGNDALIVLDEVHLSQPFQQTLAGLARHRRPADGLPDRWQVVAMSATPGKAADFGLGAADRANPVLACRLAAAKPAALNEVAVAGGANQRRAAFVAAGARHALELAQPGQVVAVVVNRVATARAVHEAVARKLGDERVVLVTGRMRPLDRMDVDAGLKERVRSGRARDAAAPPLVVVATQTIEAGADFDFDALVTECASLDALRQRFGRLDRLGRLAESGRTAQAVVLARADEVADDADDPIYGKALGNTWRWLRGLGATVDFGVDALAPHVAALVETQALEALLPPRRRAPVLLPAHLDLWAQTMPPPDPDPEVALWLHGVDGNASADVQVVWRGDLSESDLGMSRDDLEPLLARIEVCPPVGLEALAVPIGEARAWLRGETVHADVADVEGNADDHDDDDRRRDATPSRLALAWSKRDPAVIDASKLRPGMTIVVPASYGGIRGGTWDPGSGGPATPVTDLAERARWMQKRRAVLRLHPALFAPHEPIPKRPDDDDKDALDAFAKELDTLRERLREHPELRGSGRASEALAVLNDGKRPKLQYLTGIPIMGGDGKRVEQPGYWVQLSRAATADASTEPEVSSFTGVAKDVTLKAHLLGVGKWALGFAKCLDLPLPLAQAIEIAGLWHDLGKVDARFQRWLHGGNEFRALTASAPIAKSAIAATDRASRERARERSGYPRGARHELASVALLQSSPALLARVAEDVDVDLVLHLVAAHHGWCRPFAPVVPDATPVPLAHPAAYRDVEVTLSTTSDHGLERLDSGIAERFWRLVERYGWYGLAWLEALLRLADHRRSEEEQHLGAKGEGA